MMPEGSDGRSCDEHGCYIQYGYLEPAATVIGMAATVYENFKYFDDDEINEAEMTNMASLMTVAIVEHFLDKSMLAGLADLTATASSGGDWLKEMTIDTATKLIPGLGASAVSQTTADQAVFLREVDRTGWWSTFIATMESRTPGLSDNQAVRYDRWGRPSLRPVPIFGSHLF